MTAQPEPDVTDAASVTVILDPRVAYVAFGPDDGDLADAAEKFGVADATEDLADAAEQLDYAYQRGWAVAAHHAAPDVVWDATAPHHEARELRPLAAQVATSASDQVDAELLDSVTAAVTVQLDTSDPRRTRWFVTMNGEPVASASVEWTRRMIEDAGITQLAARIADDGDLLREVHDDEVTLRMYAPTGELPTDRDAIGYVLTYHDSVVFAGMDFHPSPLYAVDSDRAVEALAGFLAVRPGDVEDEYFDNYTQTQREWADGDGPIRMYELIDALPGDTEWSLQKDIHLGDGRAREAVRMWTVTPIGRADLPTAEILADCADNAGAQYPGYLSAWRADTDHYVNDDDLVPPVTTHACEPAASGQQFALGRMHGQHTLDWAIEHVNHWQVEAIVPLANMPTDVVLNIPATGCATVALCHAHAIAHDGARVDAHQRTQVTALAGSHVTIHPGACVDRRPGSQTHLAMPSAPPRLRDGATYQPLERLAQR